jgi:hypothetical protein
VTGASRSPPSPTLAAALVAALGLSRSHGTAAEKVAETILEDLFTLVLDWAKGDLDYQVEHADIVLTKNMVKYLIVEAKRPGALAWRRAAIEQARRYADEQRVTRIAVSDGVMLYAADIEHGTHHDRVFARLDRNEPPLGLWWLSVHGIYRPREGDEDRALVEEALPAPIESTAQAGDAELLHPKCHLPARCFGYVGDACDPDTWKLPHLTADGAVDAKRLPKAIQSIISNYRGGGREGARHPGASDLERAHEARAGRRAPRQATAEERRLDQYVRTARAGAPPA